MNACYESGYFSTESKIYYSNLLTHNYIKNIIKDPPKGYEFIVSSDNKKQKIISLF